MDLGVTDKVKPLIEKVRQMVSDDIEPVSYTHLTLPTFYSV